MRIVKMFGEVKSVDDGGDGPGSFSLILSTPTKDRDGEQMKTEEWQQPLPDHIAFDIDHGMKVASIVGSGRPYLDAAGRMMVDGTYASTSLAQDVRTLVNEGHVKTASVAFLRRTRTDEKGAKSFSRELLNGSFVAVPANPEARILSSKSVELEVGDMDDEFEAALKEGRRNSKSDSEMLQAMHDHAVALGASCPGTEKSAHQHDDPSEDVVVPDPDADREPMTAGVDAAATAHKAAVTAPAPAAISKEALRADIEAFIASQSNPT